MRAETAASGRAGPSRRARSSRHQSSNTGIPRRRARSAASRSSASASPCRGGAGVARNQGADAHHLGFQPELAALAHHAQGARGERLGLGEAAGAPPRVREDGDVADEPRAVPGLVEGRDGAFQDGAPLRQVALPAERPAEMRLPVRAEQVEAVLLGQGDQPARLAHLRFRRAAMAEEPAADIAERDGRRVRMAQRVGVAQRAQPDPQRLVHLAEAEQGDAEQRGAVHPRVLAEQVGVGHVPLRRVEAEREFQRLARALRVARGEQGHAEHPVADDATGLVLLPLGDGHEQFGQRRRFPQALAGHGDGEQAVEERENLRRGLALHAELQPAAAARGELRGGGPVQRGERADERRLQRHLQLPARIRVRHLVQEREPLAEVLDGFGVRRAARRLDAGLEPRARRGGEIPRRGEVVRQDAGEHGADALAAAKGVGDAGVHRAALARKHGVVGHALEQRVAELVHGFRPVMPPPQDFRVDERVERGEDVGARHAQEGGERVRREGAARAGRGLHDAAAPRRAGRGAPTASRRG